MPADLKFGKITLEYDDPSDARAVADVLMEAARREDGSIRDHGFYDDAKAIYDACARLEREEEDID